ncbi:hypothetical protein [Pedobacter cryophilus]|uniref:Uncharacterized protein n=1 Tax=Pedobacter cryophilus TaxID=2571271 RepID=A0A4U1C5P1_9SPHI|nr:hypothetical protein [Pedobacter cryophilus]TKC00709.1 hypothetical protein FA046_03255 [Pedobacter cryophilus]
MNSNFLNTIKLGLSTFSLIFIANINAFAQKASDIQEESLWAPTVKVDGKITEWEAPLKAVNKSTNLSYTIANDSKNLYLAIQSKDLTNNNKIMLGGITLTVNPTGKKKDKEGYMLTYPVINRVRRQGGGQGGGGGTVRIQGGPGSLGQFQQRTPAQRDSMQIAMAKTQLIAAKEIKIFGFKDITDSLVSIYNEYGIKAVATINEAGLFSYEIAIPLSLLEMSADKPKEFSYNIKVNGLQMGNFGGGNFGGGRPGGAGGGGGNVVTVVRTEGGGGFGGGNFQELLSPTDFWGKYILTNSK